jgi:glycosyltransferase involved in cell wall biosynthesis
MSGAEVVVANIIKHLQESGHETRLVVAEDLRTIPHDMSSPIKNSFSSYLEQFNPDVVHFHNITSIGLDPIRLCLKKGIPCLLTLHDYYIVCRNRMYFRWDLNRECTASDWTNCENCKNNVIGLPHPVEIKAVLDSVPIVCISRYQEKIIRRFGYKNTVVIYNGIQV